MAHFSRKCYSTVKQQLQKDAGYSALVLSEMDTTFMATYAAGNIISGKLGDTFNPTTVLAIGLFGSGACLFLINIALWFDFHGFNAILANVFILSVYFLFGFFQSTGGPVSVHTCISCPNIIYFLILFDKMWIYLGWHCCYGKLVL
jgi:MFS transporter, OPA family, solute carrier family 37 (glycerol-3-phosphate transporter), member 1/2